MKDWLVDNCKKSDPFAYCFTGIGILAMLVVYFW